MNKLRFARSTTVLKNSYDSIAAASRMHGRRISKQSLVYLLRHSRPMTSMSTAPQKEVTHARNFEEIPCPKLWPIIGNMKHVKNKPTKLHTTLLEGCKEHGWFYRDSLYGTKLVIIADPQSAEVLFRDEEKWPYRDFSDSFGIFFEERKALGLAKGLLERQGEDWGQLRKALGKQMLPPVKIKNYFPSFSQVANDGIQIIKRMRDDENVIKEILHDCLGRWSMESIGTFTFGQRTGLLDYPPSKEAMKVYNAVDGVIRTSNKLSRLPILKYIYRSEYNKMKEHIVDFYDSGKFFIQNIVDHLADCEENKKTADLALGSSFVANLLNNDKMSPKECATHAIDVYGGGLDTTSNSMFWIMYMLGRNLDKQDKLHEEVRQHIKDDNVVTAEMVQKMPYLRACFKEGMRLYPIAIGLPRLYLRDITLNGYNIPAKTLMIINNFAMARNEEIFENAESYIPERWLRGTDNAKDTNPFASQPFGFGVRSCVGRRIAEAEMQVFLSLLVKNLRFEYIGEEQIGLVEPLLVPDKATSFAFYDR